MRYIELTISTSGLGTEILSSKLMEMGLTDIMVDDPMLDMKMIEDADETEYVDREEFDFGREASVAVYFEYGDEGIRSAQDVKALVKRFGEEVREGLYGEGFDAGSLLVTTEVRDDGEWKDNWKAYFKPTKISDRVVIRPSWEEYDASGQGGEIVVTINPGMAFGTGTHETTSLSVKALEKYLRHGDRVLDVGCGTGILAIIASKLGAAEALGIDIDEAAVDASNENIVLNDCIDNVAVRIGDLTKGVEYEADVVVANLLTPLVLKFTGDVSRHLATNGIYISSGILTEHEPRVISKLEECGYEVIEIMEDGDWCSITAAKKG